MRGHAVEVSINCTGGYVAVVVTIDHICDFEVLVLSIIRAGSRSEGVSKVAHMLEKQ